MNLQCCLNVLTFKTPKWVSSLPSDRGTGQFVLISTHTLSSAGPIPSDGISRENIDRRDNLLIFHDYCHHSPREQDTRKTNSKEVLLQLAALVMRVLIYCWDGTCSVKTGNWCPWSLTMSQLVQSDSFQTHMIWPHFYKDRKRLYIPSPSVVRFWFPASKPVRAKASHQNGFPAKHFYGKEKSILSFSYLQNFFCVMVSKNPTGKKN